MNRINFIKLKDEIPLFGEPILIYSFGVVQNIVYMLDGDEECKTLWFEPYHFDVEDELKVPFNKIEEWVYLDQIRGGGEQWNKNF